MVSHVSEDRVLTDCSVLWCLADDFGPHNEAVPEAVKNLVWSEKLMEKEKGEGGER